MEDTARITYNTGWYGPTVYGYKVEIVGLDFLVHPKPHEEDRWVVSEVSTGCAVLGSDTYEDSLGALRVAEERLAKRGPEAVRAAIEEKRAFIEMVQSGSR